MTGSDRYRADDPDRKFLQSRAWREHIRPYQLRNFPFCRFCHALGFIRIAEQVDHITRPRGNRELQRDPANFQSLCGPHHQLKSLWERRCEKRGKLEPLVLGYSLDGWPVEAPQGGEGKSLSPFERSADDAPSQP